MIQKTTIEEIVHDTINTGSFSHSNTRISIEDYTDNHTLNEDWTYFLSRDIERNRKEIKLDLEPHRYVSPVRVYKAIPKNHPIKKKTNRPALPHLAYFTLLQLIKENPNDYKNDDGYVQVARDLKDQTGTKANLGNVWSGTKKYHDKLGWSGMIELPLENFDTIEELIKQNTTRYENDEGYIQLARDLKKQTGTKANLGHVWSGTKKYHDKLGWSGIINLPLEDFDTLGELIEQNTTRYENDEGYIQLARDLKKQTGTKANLAQLWSGTKKYHDKLGWSGIINLPLEDFDTLGELIEQNTTRYENDEGYIQLARDLKKQTGTKANLAQLWSGTKKYHDKLGWSGMIELPLEDFDTLGELIEQNTTRYENDEGYIQLARDLKKQTGTKANLGNVWSGTKKYRNKLGWSGMINLPLEDFDTLGELIEQNTTRYEKDEGYIQLARDLKKQTGTKANLGHALVWH